MRRVSGRDSGPRRGWILHGGYPTEVFNVLGAGDAFMAGLLSGRLRGRDWAESGRIANACGSLAVSRHACAPAMPSEAELAEFFARALTVRELHADPVIAHLHRVTTGRRPQPEVLALAFDHREQFLQLARRCGAAPAISMRGCPPSTSRNVSSAMRRMIPNRLVVSRRTRCWPCSVRCTRHGANGCSR